MPPLLLNSITDAGPSVGKAVAVTGSHGGLYAAYLTSKAGLRAAIFNDAGGGLDDAGIAGMMALADVGMAAAAVAHTSTRIGDADDMMARGILSKVNPVAAALGLAAGMACRQAADLLQEAPLPPGFLPPVAEARQVIDRIAGPDVVLVDSASLIEPGDAGKIVVTGSHSGLIGGDPARAIKADAMAAVFNDAGVGANDAGIARLPALDQRGIAAVTVAHTSARIGDAGSAWETGVISHANAHALALGAAPGLKLLTWIDVTDWG